jgi:hypothetical protein
MVSSCRAKFLSIVSNFDKSLTVFFFQNRRVRPLSGILEILASDTVVWTTPITNVNGPICLYCDRHVNRIYRAATKSCKSCRSNFMTTLFPPNPRFLNLSKKEVRRDKTLVFLCARLSSGDELTEGYFDKIATSLKQSERWVSFIHCFLFISCLTFSIIFYFQQPRTIW